jgi:hypothetical protein
MGSQRRSLGPYQTQLTRYTTPRLRDFELRIAATSHSWSSSMITGGGGGVTVRKGVGGLGERRETWKTL